MMYRGWERVKKQRSIPRIGGDAEGLIFHSHLSILVSNLFFGICMCVMSPKQLYLLIVAKDCKEYLVIIWLVVDAFVVLTVHGIISLSFICFPQHPCSTAGKVLFIVA